MLRLELYKLEEEALLNLQKAFNIPIDAWENLLKEMEKFNHPFFKEYYTKPHLVKHTEYLPPQLIMYVESLLKHIGMHPFSICIKNSKELDIHQESLAGSSAPELSYIPETSYDNIHTEKPGFIAISPYLMSLFCYNKKERSLFKWIILHEVTHLLENHSWKAALIEKILLQYIPSNILYNSAEWINYCKIHELQADLFPCMSDIHLRNYALSYIKKMLKANASKHEKAQGALPSHFPELFFWLKKIHF